MVYIKPPRQANGSYQFLEKKLNTRFGYTCSCRESVCISNHGIVACDK